jgi:hypothetical protein
MSSLAWIVRRPQLKYTVALLILSIWMAQATDYSYPYWYRENPDLRISLLDGMVKLEFLGRAIIFTFIVICLLRSWAYVFADSGLDRGRRSLSLLGTVALRVVAALIIVNLWNIFQNSPERNCERYTRMMTSTYMGGNIFEEGGHRYEIKLCSVTSFAPLFPGRVRLQLFSVTTGELLAERIFYWSSANDWFWDSRVISKDPGKLNYGWGDDDGYAGRLSLPPTKLDWLRARLP